VTGPDVNADDRSAAYEALRSELESDPYFGWHERGEPSPFTESEIPFDPRRMP